MSSERTKHVALFPWNMESLGLRVSVAQATFDFDRPAPIDHERHFIDADEPFDKLRVVFTVSLPSEVRRVVAEPAARLAILVRTSCEDTRLRRGRVIELDASGSMTVHEELEQIELHGTALLEFELVRLDPVEPQPPLASIQGARLATARPWEVRIDRKRELAGVYLDVRFRDFRESGPAAERENLYRLEINEDAPVLWLNESREQIVTAFNARARSGHAAQLRDVLFDLVVPPVWSQLFFRAAFDAEHAGQPLWPWQEAVLLQVGRLLYGERCEFEALLQHVKLGLKDVPSFLQRVDAALQAHHELLLHANRLAGGAT